MTELKGYARPNDKISELVRVGTLTRLKKGLYTLSDNPQLSKELVANHLHGPSYVSCHWALSYYGLLPEAISSVSSICIDRAREYSNSLGRFTYHRVPAAYYKIGLNSQGSGQTAFVIATPTKALCDLLVTTRQIRIQSLSAMKQYLFDDLRLDEADVGALELQIVNDCRSAQYKSQMLSLLSKSIESAP
ncbi:hypothetical protein AB833_06160 [Chromatiales bacterium (ex Bugula neritina AB1)]|nr:hypothetical protein AB833_06160 [Chromatiales bacterium (ex Bugula neritina AB1)]